MNNKDDSVLRDSCEKIFKAIHSNSLSLRNRYISKDYIDSLKLLVNNCCYFDESVRVVLNLRLFERLSIKKISEQIGSSEYFVSNYAKNGLRKLVYLDKRYGIYSMSLSDTKKLCSQLNNNKTDAKDKSDKIQYMGLCLSKRPVNCLKRAGITNIAELISYISDCNNKDEIIERLITIRNIGKKSAEEIYSQLIEHKIIVR